MTTNPPITVFHDQRADLHDTGPTHPERPERLVAIRPLVRSFCDDCMIRPEEAGWKLHGTKLHQAIHAIHTRNYVDRFEHACAQYKDYIDTMDSAICPDSFEAALASAACSLAGAEAVATGKSRRVFVPMRPPGHHCERDRSMGFCLFNNIAIAANWLIENGGVERVAIVDFDVHHGNGTQHLFDSRDDVLYISTHQHPATIFPGTGYEDEIGNPDTPGEGYTLNHPFHPGSDHDEAIAVYENTIIPRLVEYEPQILLISAGFDADAREPIANLQWNPTTYEIITRLLVGVADQFADGRVLSILEGGYDLSALQEGLEAHLKILSVVPTQQ